MTRLAVAGLELRPGADPSTLPDLAARRLGVPVERIGSWQILRRSLDARGRRDPRYVYRLGLEVRACEELLGRPGVTPWEDRAVRLVRPRVLPSTRPLVVGAGPAGLFAALRLTDYGLRPLILERGASVDRRVRDVAAYWRRGTLDPESNVQFGEGGAGTFSDGKLTYRGKDPRRAWVLQELVDAGAVADILWEARPHLGTDRLRGVLRCLRSELLRRGGEIRFGVRVDRLLLHQATVAGVVTGAGPIPGCPVFLAPGHSARDLISALAGQGVVAQGKGFAFGVRLESSQSDVDRNQFGTWAGSPHLPAAEFQVKARSSSGRDVYSFCMCPGGVVIPAGSEPRGLVVNGMSAAKRTGRWANAGIVVTVEPGDAGEGPLAGFGFQREWEARAQEVAGPGRVPAQRVVDFLERRVSRTLPHSSCPWQLVPADLTAFLPGFVAAALGEALPALCAQVHALRQGVLIGVESRTSSPVRLTREADLQATGMPDLYPVGEGAGYAGGIMSSAIDGVRAADGYARRLGGGAFLGQECLA